VETPSLAPLEPEVSPLGIVAEEESLLKWEDFGIAKGEPAWRVERVFFQRAAVAEI
jgi:hypothetical protein